MPGATAESSTLRRAAFPTLFAWAQLWLCRRQWWAEACLVVTLHPLPPHPAHPASWLALGNSSQQGQPAVPVSQGSAGLGTAVASPVCSGLTVCSPQGLWMLRGREGARGLGHFFQGGSSPSSQEGIPFLSPPLCWEHYSCVGGNDNVELNEN